MLGSASAAASRVCRRVACRRYPRRILPQLEPPSAPSASSLVSRTRFYTCRSLGTNDELDTRGVDFSLFEPSDESDEYARLAQHAHIQPRQPKHRPSSKHDPIVQDDQRNLTHGAKLLRRLIREKEFKSAAQVLAELKLLESPLGEPLNEYADAALWFLQDGNKTDALHWLELVPLSEPPNKTRRNRTALERDQPLKLVLGQFFTLLLNRYTTDLALLQQAVYVAVSKGHMSTVRTAFIHLLRHGTASQRTSSSSASTAQQTWSFFTRLTDLAIRDSGSIASSDDALALRQRLGSLYNLGVRTLALSGRLNDAVGWARKSLGDNGHLTRQVLRLELFSHKLLVEELVSAGGEYIETAKALNDEIEADMQTKSQKEHGFGGHRSHIAKINKLLPHADLGNWDPTPRRQPVPVVDPYQVNKLDKRILACLDRDDVIGARDVLLDSINIEPQAPNKQPQLKFGQVPKSAQSMFALEHLPSAAVLSQLQRAARRIALIQAPSSPSVGKETEGSTQMLNARAFLDPVQLRLRRTRAGKGLWETARLYAMVDQEEWRKALHFYQSKAGFCLEAGGITRELIQQAGGASSARLDDPWDTTHDTPRQERGLLWPSTHAVNLALHAIVGLCRHDPARLEAVYAAWKRNSFREEDLDGNDAGQLRFESWPPGYAPDSYTFDPFLHAFAHSKRGGWRRALEVIREMTDSYRIRPSVATWTILLEAFANQRWDEGAERLAMQMGIITRPGVKPARADPDNPVPQATLETYTALINSLINKPSSKQNVREAAWIRDDLLVRMRSLPTEPDDLWKPLAEHRSQLLANLPPDQAVTSRQIWSAADMLASQATVDTLQQLHEYEAAGQ